MNQAFQKLNLKQNLLEIYRAALEEHEEEDMPSAAEVESFLDQTEEEWNQLKGHFTGSTAFSIGDFREVVEVFERNQQIRSGLHTQGDGEDLDALKRENELDMAEIKSVANQLHFLAEVQNGDELLNKLDTLIHTLLDKQPKDVEEPLVLHKESRNGATVYTLKFQSDEEADPSSEAQDASSEDEIPEWMFPDWTVHDGVLAVAFTGEALDAVVAQLDAPPSDALSASPEFQEAAAYVGLYDSLVYLNPARLDALIRQGIAASDTPTPQGEFTPTKLMDWLALDALMPYVLASRMEEDGFQFKARMGFTRETPLSRILHGPIGKDPAPTPTWVHKDMGYVAGMRWSLGDFWSRLETELNTLAPQAAAGMGMARLMATSQLGFDLKLQFLDHLDDGIVMGQKVDPELIEEMYQLSEEGDAAELMAFSQKHPTNGQYILFGLELKNPGPIESAMGTLLARLHPEGVPEPEMFQGHPIHYLIPAPPGNEHLKQMVAYTVLDGYLLLSVGDPSLLRKAITANADADTRIWNDPAYLNMRDRAPASVGMYEYTSERYIEASFKSIEFLLSTLPGDVEMDFTPLKNLWGGSLGSGQIKGLIYETEGFTEIRVSE